MFDSTYPRNSEFVVLFELDFLTQLSSIVSWTLSQLVQKSCLVLTTVGERPLEPTCLVHSV